MRLVAAPTPEKTRNPEAALWAATLSATGALIAPVLEKPFTMIPERLLLYASIRSKAAFTGPAPVGERLIPLPPLSATSVVDSEKLLLALGSRSIPLPV